MLKIWIVTPCFFLHLYNGSIWNPDSDTLNSVIFQSVRIDGYA